MKRPDDVIAAINLGVDAVGVILHADSPRLINKQTAKELRECIPANVLFVGVFVDASLEMINEYSTEVGLDLVQLHGSETNRFGKSLNTPFIKAIRVNDEISLVNELSLYPDACALLLEPYVSGRSGGTGMQLDLNLWPTNSEQKLILAGGLSPLNLKNILQKVAPFGVDLNSGVEKSPAVKDIALINNAINVINCD